MPVSHLRAFTASPKTAAARPRSSADSLQWKYDEASRQFGRKNGSSKNVVAVVVVVLPTIAITFKHR